MKPVTAIYPGSFDPGDQRPPRPDRARRQNFRPPDRRRAAEPRQRTRSSRERARGDAARGDAELGQRRGGRFDGLLVDYARQREARVILRGIRAISDYEYELQMAMMNRKLEPDIETVFMLPAKRTAI